MIRIEHLLSREIGLCAASIGTTAVELAVKTRMREAGIGDFERYLHAVQQSRVELRALIEHIVVSETWFFRDADVFRTLLEHVNGAGRKARAGHTLRVLTIPCATGEEAYSIAITLLDGGFSPESFRIQAFDVSQRAISSARRGIYGKNSFRGEALGDRRRYFEALDGSDLQVGQAARASLSIEEGNLLDSALLPNHAQFDVIFCRNVLIYLDRAARTRAFDNLLGWLTGDGILFAGHAEALDRMDPRFRRLDTTSHFAYVRRAGAPEQEAVARSSSASPAGVSSASRQGLSVDRAHQQRILKAPVKARKTSPTPNLELSSVDDALSRVGRLADRGELPAAARECERIIASYGASAEAYCLLGVVRKASGESDAALECFTKALYLNRQHYESLVHVALLHEQRGDRASASNFRRRAERTRKQAEK